MSEESKSLINVSVIPDSVDNALKNVTDKPTLSIGTTISDLWQLVFGRISYWKDKRDIRFNHNLEIFRRQLDSQAEGIPPEKLVEPSIQITAQALENSKYCIDQEILRDMFVALISNSMNSDYQNAIHPSFAEILKQMSALDARVIQLFKDKKAFPVCQYCINFSGNTFSNTPIPEHIFLEFPDVDIMLCSQALSSLLRLGLISISYLSTVTEPNAYDKFSQYPIYEAMKKFFSDKATIRKGAITLTPLGRSFVEVCVN